MIKAITIKKILSMIGNSITRMIDHDGIEIAGYLAFLTLISIFPCAIFLTKLIGFINYFLSTKFGEDFILQHIIQSFDSIQDIPINTLRQDIENILIGPPKALINFAIIGILWTSSSTMQGLKTILNRSYNVENRPPYIFTRLYSIIQFIFVSFITIILILTIQIIPNIFEYINQNIGNFSLNFLSPKIVKYFKYYGFLINIFFLIIYTLFLNIMLTNTKLTIKKVLPGSLITVCLWIISSKILIAYFTKFIQFSLIYGSLANIISILIYFYVIFVCFIFGSEFNYQYLKYKNTKIINNKNSVL
jgi:membrane protein